MAICYPIRESFSRVTKRVNHAVKQHGVPAAAQPHQGVQRHPPQEIQRKTRPQGCPDPILITR
jgi:hypothetical protein